MLEYVTMVCWWREIFDPGIPELIFCMWSFSVPFFVFFFFNLLIFFSLLGLLSRLMWPLFHVTSKTPLYLKLRKVSMSLLGRLTSASLLARGQWWVCILVLCLGAHTKACCLFPVRVGDVPKKHLLSENLHLRNFRPWGKNGVEGYKSLFFTL